MILEELALGAQHMWLREKADLCRDEGICVGLGEREMFLLISQEADCSADSQLGGWTISLCAEKGASSFRKTPLCTGARG